MSEGRNLRSIGKQNINSLMKLLIMEKSSSRRGLAEKLGITKMTVSNIVTQLKKDGYVIEVPDKDKSNTIGPKPTAIKIAPKSILAVGVHISSTMITVNLVDIVDGVLYEKVVPVDNKENDHELVNRIKEQITILLQEEEGYVDRIVGIGVTYSGMVDSEAGKIVFSRNHIGKEVLCIQSTLEKAFGFPAYVANEEEGAALAELVFGRLPAKKVYYINIGESIRGAYINEYSLEHGAFGMSGEIDHVSIKYDGPLCLCGSRGCYHLYAGIDVLCKESKCHSLEELALKLQDREPLVLRVVEEFIQATVTLLVNIVNIYDPHMILLGGEIIKIDSIIFKKMERLLNERILFRKDRYVKIECTKLKQNTITSGAGLVVLEKIGSLS